MEKTARTKKIILNATISLSGHLLVTLLGFVVRLIFVRFLAVELLGVNGVFASIITIFSLAELGFTVAVSYALYKPLANKEEKKVAALMRYYKKIYITVGCFILVAGLATLPFLQYIISSYKDLDIGLNSLRVFYIIFLAITIVPYFISYKRTLIVADQKKFVPDLVVMIVSIIKLITQIVIIITLKDFIGYLLVALAASIIEQTIINIIVTKKYPYMRTYAKEKLTKSDKKSLFTNIGALSIARASSAFTAGIVSIIILSFVGLREVGLYSNYLLVVTSLTVILTLLFSSATASVGNFAATETKPAQKELFKKILYINAFLGILILVGLLYLLNDFIIVWLGADMVLGNLTAIVISIDIFIGIMRYSSWILYEANGLYKHFFYRSFFEIAVFIGLAIPGAIYWGVAGVVAAKTIAAVVTQIPFEVYVVSKYALGVKANFYLALLTRYIAVAMVAVGVSFPAIYFIPQTGILGFFIKGIIITAVVAIVFVCSTLRTKEFKYFKETATALIFRKLKRKSQKIEAVKEK